MSDALIESIRKILACPSCSMDAEFALDQVPYCGDCLRLVLAHCGEMAQMVLSCFCDSADNCVCVARSDENIGRMFGIKNEKL